MRIYVCIPKCKIVAKYMTNFQTSVLSDLIKSRVFLRIFRHIVHCFSIFTILTIYGNNVIRVDYSGNCNFNVKQQPPNFAKTE